MKRAVVSLGDLLADAKRPDGTLEFAVPDDWLQGRTAYGGLTMAATYRAASAVADDLPPMRSAQIAFVGPVADRARVRATLLRRGRSSAFVEARIGDGSDTAMVAVFVFLSERESSVQLAASQAGPFPPPETAEPAMRRSGPGFASQLEYRHALPKAERTVPELMRWVRLRDRAGLDPVTELLAIGDALPPAVTPLLAKPAPLSTTNWTVNLVDAHPTTADGWWLVASKADFAVGGVSSQTMSVANRDGCRVMCATQQVSIYG